MKRKTFEIGQKVVIEGMEINNFYFVERGEFEISKYIYAHKKRNLVFYEYLRFCSTRDNVFLKQLLNSDTKTLFSPHKNEYDIFGLTKKGLTRK